jgi:hypothetical protein
MKASAFYFLADCIACISCKSINHSIGMREVYQYPSNFKLKTMPDLNTMLQEPEQVFFINANTDTTYMEIRVPLFLSNLPVYEKMTQLSAKEKLRFT